ncbi:MAG: type III secretion protein [Stenotrophomonas acidaminiphila]|nr:MAG: type III secretion protein [Stenotrophomonas acidaminiphila]
MEALTNFAVLFALAALRYLPVMVLPGFSPLTWAPTFIRVVVMLAFAWLTVLGLPDAGPISAPAWPMALLLAAAGELLVGTVFGLAFMLPNAAVHSAGWLVDMQAGLGAATLFNPTNANAAESLLGHALMLVATVLFFTLDLHLALFKGISASLRVLPLGSVGLQVDSAGVFAMLGRSFSLGLLLVAPIVLGLFCVDLGVGYASRSMPQANVYFLALPLKVAVAMGLMVLTLAYMPMLMGRLFHGALQQVPASLGAP